ncbi:hypothetical protein KY361_06935 [Candidatus Woesearchaeota archaeon]|nr:hypothetical protein [Candidatus Woesearchaeota archaeon]
MNGEDQNVKTYDELYQTVLRNLDALGIDIPEERVNLRVINERQAFDERLKDRVRSYTFEEAEGLFQLEQLARACDQKTIGNTSFSTNAEGEYVYDVTVIVDDGNTLQATNTASELRFVNVVAHELGGHVYQHEYGRWGEALQPHFDKTSKLESRIKELTRTMRRNAVKIEKEKYQSREDDDFSYMRPKLRRDLYKMEVERIVHTTPHIVKSKAAFKDMKEFYDLVLMADRLGNINDRTNVGMLLALGATSLSNEPLTERQARYKRKEQYLNNIRDAYNEFLELVPQYLKAKDKAPRLKNEAKFVSEGWAEYVGEAVLRRYQQQTGQTDILYGPKQIGDFLDKQVTEAKQAYEKETDPDNRDLIKAHIELLEMQKPSRSPLEGLLPNGRAVYDAGMNAFFSIGNFEKARNFALGYNPVLKPADKPSLFRRVLGYIGLAGKETKKRAG